MGMIAMEDIKESNRLKREACDSCMEQLNGILSKKQLDRFEDIFYSAAGKYVFSKKESKENKCT